MDSDFVKVGKIVNTFGIKGELKIYLSTDFPEDRFQKGKILFIGKESLPNEIEVEVESSKPFKNLYLLKFKNYSNINDVEKYKNYYLWITKDMQGDLEEGEFYYHQIIGCRVITVQGKEIGIIKEIISTGANDVWVVKAHDMNKKDILIPYIESVVKEINIEEQKVIIEEMEGLLSE